MHENVQRNGKRWVLKKFLWALAPDSQAEERGDVAPFQDHLTRRSSASLGTVPKSSGRVVCTSKCVQSAGNKMHSNKTHPTTRRIHFPRLFPDFPKQNKSFSLTNLFTPINNSSCINYIGCVTKTVIKSPNQDVISIFKQFS